MKTRWAVSLVLVAGYVFFFKSQLATQPSFNGTTPGCSGGGCHSLSGNIVAVQVNGLTVSINVSGTASSVAGELVDSAGTVVAFNNKTSTNPFSLTAPKAGLYRVNAGYDSPGRVWDSLLVNVGTTTGVAENVPAHFSLSQNYPNPFNPGTTIAFSLPSPAYVSLQVFDLEGRTVATLEEGLLQAGDHRSRFDGNGLASGVYFYRLQAGRLTQTAKMLLQK